MLLPKDTNMLSFWAACPTTVPRKILTCTLHITAKNMEDEVSTFNPMLLAA